MINTPSFKSLPSLNQCDDYIQNVSLEFVVNLGAALHFGLESYLDFLSTSTSKDNPIAMVDMPNTVEYVDRYHKYEKQDSELSIE